MSRPSIRWLPMSCRGSYDQLKVAAILSLNHSLVRSDDDTFPQLTMMLMIMMILERKNWFCDTAITPFDCYYITSFDYCSYMLIHWLISSETKTT